MFIRRWSRQLAMAVTMLIILFSVLFSTATPAAASASGCVQNELEPNSCVFVAGASDWVDYVAGGVRLLPRQSARGHFEIYTTPNRDGLRSTPPLHFNSRDATYWNQSYVHGQTFWGPAFGKNGELYVGEKVCAIFWELRGGVYHRNTPTCVEIRL